VGPRAGLDGCGKCRLHRDSIPGPSNPNIFRTVVTKRLLKKLLEKKLIERFDHVPCEFRNAGSPRQSTTECKQRVIVFMSVSVFNHNEV
jgi:hypothetical protein